MQTAIGNFPLILATLLAANSMAMGVNKNGVSVSKDGQQTSIFHAAKRWIPQDAQLASGPVKMFDNSSRYPLGVYWCCNGWTISGTGSQLGFQTAEAMPFTPTMSATVTHIGVAIGYISGDNQVIVSLNADSGGLPGTSLGSFTAANLPALGTCCAVEVGTIPGISVTAGTQYWIVVQTSTSNSTTWAAWNENDTDQSTQNFAFQNSQDGSGWISTEGILGAFGVGGTVP